MTCIVILFNMYQKRKVIFDSDHLHPCCAYLLFVVSHLGWKCKSSVLQRGESVSVYLFLVGVYEKFQDARKLESDVFIIDMPGLIGGVMEGEKAGLVSNGVRYAEGILGLGVPMECFDGW